ncbi:MAG: argF [Bacillales bacterium]|jgi:ornithine carbamoyltransferase|nr:argF [Bacillales bacterium]
MYNYKYDYFKGVFYMQKTLSLKGRSFLRFVDFSKEEILDLIDIAEKFKTYKKNGVVHKYLEGKNIALIFEKTSTRTRVAFTIAANDLGMNAEFFNVSDIQLSKKESVEDTAIFLGSMFDGIEYRGFSHSVVEQLAEFSGVPVWNGLTDDLHPTQLLADLLTIKEKLGSIFNAKIVYIGDGRNNVANTWLLGSAMLGLDIRICTPDALMPDNKYIVEAHELAKSSDAKILISSNIEQCMEGANVVYTDVWASMGEEDIISERVALLKEYQVNSELMNLSNEENVYFMHCLPAFHDLNTDFAVKVKNELGIDLSEVTDEVFRSKNSIVFQQAENRMHTIKALIYSTL